MTEKENLKETFKLIHHNDIKGALIHVWRGLDKQGWKKSVSFIDSGGPVCTYRGDDDCKCGLGHLIRDENYDGDLEGMSARLMRKLISPMTEEFYSVILKVQSCHDQSSSPEDMRGLFNKLLRQYEVVIPS